MASIPTISSRATPAELQRFARAVKNFLDSGEFKLDTTAISKQIDRALRDYEEQTTDLTPPGPPVELVVTGLFDKIMLEWGPATGNVAYYEVFRNMEDDLGNAAMVSPRIGAAMWVDTPPDSSLSATYYYWVRAVSPAGVAGPFNAAAGTPGSTANDPAYLLEVLAGQLGYGQFDVANGVFPVRLWTGANLPVLPNAKLWPPGSFIFWNKDDKMYRTVDGQAWSSAVSAEDIVGEIVSTQISDNAITTPKLRANAVSADKLAANSVTAGKIAAGAILADKIGANEVITNTANISNGIITNAKIKDLSADKITAGTITAAITTIGQYLRSSDSTVVLDMANKLFKMRSSAGHEVEITPGSVKFKRYGVALPIFEFTGNAVIMRNTSGQTLLQSGGYIQYDMVEGGPPSDADKTGSNKAYDTYRVGGDYQDSIVRAGNKITASNQATYISSLLVGNAWIGNAAVNTLKIADNAVTVPVSSNSETEVVVSTGSSFGYVWATAFSFPINSDGQPIHINSAVSVQAISTSGTLNLYVRFKIGSSYTTQRLLGSRRDNYDSVSLAFTSLPILEELSGTTGTQTVSMEFGAYNGIGKSQLSIGVRRLLALGVKR